MNCPGVNIQGNRRSNHSMAIASACTMISATMDAVSTLPIGGSSFRNGNTSGLVSRITACDS